MPVALIFTLIISAIITVATFQGMARFQARTNYEHIHDTIIDNTLNFIGHHCYSTPATLTRYRYNPADCPNADNMACSALTKDVELYNSPLTLEFIEGGAPVLQLITNSDNARAMANYFTNIHHWRTAPANTIRLPLDRLTPLADGPQDLMLTASGIDRNCGRSTRQDAGEEYNADPVEWPTVPPATAKNDNNLDSCDPMTARPCFAAALNQTLSDRPPDTRQHCYDIALPARCN